MENRSQFVRRPRFQWSLLLTVLLGLCSLSAPHLLSHAHVHHNGGGTSRSSTSHRSRSGSNSAEGEHESDAVGSLHAFDPHTPTLAAIVPSAHLIAPVQWIALEAVVSQDEAPASLFPGTIQRGRAPPVA